jgi:hypothetical protein
VFSGFNPFPLSPGSFVTHWLSMDGSSAPQSRKLGFEITLEVPAPKIGASLLQKELR